jgi:CheY-like chemotaxis protein
MHILISEDDFTSRTVLTGVPTKQGYEVAATVNGTEAWGNHSINSSIQIIFRIF